MLVRKNNFIILLISPLLFLISYIFSLQGPSFSKDYMGYYYYYYYEMPKTIEPVFHILVNLLKSFNLEFGILLLLFFLGSIFFKILSIPNFIIRRDVKFINIFFFCSFYFVVFFALWDLTQIRVGLGMAFYIYGLSCKDKRLKNLFYLLSILTHYSLFIVFVAKLIYEFFKNKSYAFFLAFLINFLIFTLLKFSPYQESYDSYEYNEVTTFFSAKLFFVFLSIIYIYIGFYFRKVESLIDLTSLYISFFLMLTYVFLYSNYPVIAIRFLELSLFFVLFTLSFLKQNKYFFYYSFLTLMLFSFYFIRLYYLSENSLINFMNWGN
ncbi:EpsG family protein [Acinetobacter baumannii]